MNGYVIDIPRTIFSLKLSRRLGRLAEVPKIAMALDENMQYILIEEFFDNLRRFIRADRTIQARGIEFHVGTADEMTEIIRTGKSETF